MANPTSEPASLAMLATVSGRYVQADKAEEMPEKLVGLI
jgi:hypothetical protein